MRISVEGLAENLDYFGAKVSIVHMDFARFWSNFKVLEDTFENAFDFADDIRVK